MDIPRRYVKQVLQRVHGRLGKILEDPINSKVISLKPDGPIRGAALISWRIGAFVASPDQPRPYYHQAEWLVQKMAEIFLNLGYEVDLIDKNNRTFLPKKKYAFFIDSRMNLKRLTPLLNKDCVKIYFITVSNCHRHNAAEARRILALQERRQVTLQARLYMDTQYESAVEYADCLLVFSEESAREYAFARKPAHQVPNAVPYVYPWPDKKDFEACRKRFLWLGSMGMVHKGLDLVLEAFSEMPEYHLTVCGGIEKEEDFKRAYFKELFQTPNIYTHGWSNVRGGKFTEIVNSCIGMIFPSCAEVVPGAVLTSMHAGLIPIVSYESKIEVCDDWGVILHDSSIAEIKHAVKKISSLSAEELKQMARKAWEIARANHTIERFGDEFRKMIEKLRADFSK